jgi:hypothetical protein
MQDIRLRIMSACILSAGAFVSIWAAVAVLAWLCVFGPVLKIARKARTLIPVFALVIFFGIVYGLSGGDGLSYCIRMSAILLIGAWMLAMRKPNELMNFTVWLMGSRIGFDTGMAAEAGIRALSDLRRDLERFRIATNLKGICRGLWAIVPSGLFLVTTSLTRAKDMAEMLAVRVYRNGGSWSPEFPATGPADLAAFVSSVCIVFFAIVPVSEFFILYR